MRPTASKAAAAFVRGAPSVVDGEVVTVLRSEPDFAWVRTGHGHQGFVKANYLRPRVAGAGRAVHRQSGLQLQRPVLAQRRLRVRPRVEGRVVL